jgi:hypothetical protein
MRFAKFTEN